MFFIAMLLYAPHYCLTASAGILACGQRKRTGSNPRIACPQSRFARRYSQHLAVCDSHFRRSVLFRTNRNELRCVLLSLPANQSTNFKGRTAKQAEHREAMTKQKGNRQIELARI